LTNYEDLEKDLRENDWKTNDLDTEDELESYSTSVNWDGSIEVSKNNEKYKVNLSGSAIAEISYDRWTDTYGYVITDFSISKNS